MQLQGKLLIHTPLQLDKHTRLIDIKTTSSSIIYTYEIDIAKDALGSEDRQTIKKSVTRTTCNESKSYLDANILLKYMYKHAKTKTELLKFDVNSVSCFSL